MMVASFMVLGMAGTAQADIIIVDGNVPGNPDENILFQLDQVGLTVQGVTNQTGALFSFTEDNEPITTAQAQGQAVITGAGETGTFDYLLIDAVDPNTFYTQLEANINLSGNGTITVTAVDSDGDVFSESWQGTGSGQNFFNVLVAFEQLIDTVLIQTTGDLIVDIRQVRVGGVQGPGITPIPEPASLLLFGTGLAGLGGAMRRRMKARKGA